MIERFRNPSLTVLLLAVGIGSYLVVQSVILVETGGRQTDQIVRTAWFVIVAVGVPLALVSAVFR